MKEWVEKMIVFDNVSKTYPNGVKGLQNINLTINEGEFVSIIGLSGAGKSTLLRSVNRLEPITTGEIKVNNRSITRASKSIFGLFTKEDYERTVDALASVGLSDKLHTRSDELSGGQQQRVLIARALVQQAPVILADEPVASLDPITTQKVMDDLKEINETLNKTILVNLHSIPLARDYSTRIIALKAGEVVFDGVPSELTDERLEKIYGQSIFDERQGDVSEN